MAWWVYLAIVGWVLLVTFFLVLLHGNDHPPARALRAVPKSPDPSPRV
jgi:hypothetical protein